MKDILIDLYSTPRDPYVAPDTLVAELGIKFEKWDAGTMTDRIWLRNVDMSTVPEKLPIYMTLVDAKPISISEWNRRVEQRKRAKKQRKNQARAMLR